MLYFIIDPFGKVELAREISDGYRENQIAGDIEIYRIDGDVTSISELMLDEDPANDSENPLAIPEVTTNPPDTPLPGVG